MWDWASFVTREASGSDCLFDECSLVRERSLVRHHVLSVGMTSS